MAIPRKRKAKPKTTTSRAGSFRDRGFRLAVIDALWNLGHFQVELAAARQADDPAAAIDALIVTPAQLAEVETLAPDGGDEIYDVLGGGGDDRAYDLRSLEDVALLPNLTKVRLFAMCDLAIDLAPLLAVAKLAEVTLRLGSRKQPVLAQLAKRGVKVS